MDTCVLCTELQTLSRCLEKAVYNPNTVVVIDQTPVYCAASVMGPHFLTIKKQNMKFPDCPHCNGITATGERPVQCINHQSCSWGVIPIPDETKPLKTWAEIQEELNQHNDKLNNIRET